MRHIHSIDIHRIVAPAARSALHFAARRAGKRIDAWRPIALFWRQKRKELERVRTTRLALTAGAVSLAQFYLHFVIRGGDGAPRRSKHLLPIATDHQTRIMMEHRKTITQSRMDLAQPHRTQPAVQARTVMEHQRTITHFRMDLAQPNRAQSTIKVSSLRHAQKDLGTKLHTTAQSSTPARQDIVPSVTTRGAIHMQFLIPGSSRIGHGPPTSNLGGTHLRVKPGETMDGKDRIFQAVQAYRIEPHLYRSRSAVLRHSVPTNSQESTLAQLNFQPQALVWRRATQPAAENAGKRREWDRDALEAQSHGRSLTGKEAVFEMSHSFVNAPTTPAIKIDSALIDRLTDDVIRRVERRARIERARQGL